MLFMTSCSHPQHRPVDALPNHIATLTKYLQKYRVEVDQRPHYFSKFSEYLIACCLRKMRRRIIHWSSSGYITILKEINDMGVADAFNRIGCVRAESQKHRGDLCLCTCLLQSDYVEKFMEEYPQSSVTKLLVAFQVSVDDNIPKKWVNPYNKETCIVFHHLLVSMLLNYLKAHNKFHNEKLEKPKLGVDLWNITYLLWRLSQSQILVDHLKMLEQGGKLSIP